MRLFIDTGSVAEVEEIAAWGVLSGATTNPSLLAKEEGDPGDDDPAHLRAGRRPGVRRGRLARRRRMVAEGRALRTLHEHVVVKVPFSPAGLAATRELTADGHPGQHDARLLADQALLTAEAGATYISCFMGRLDDISIDSAAVVARDRRGAAARAATRAQVLAASIRHPEHVDDRRAARLRGRDGAGRRCCARCSTIR